MNDLLDVRITETLTRRADTLDAAPRTGVDQIIARGDRIRRRRQAVAGAAAALVVLAAGGLALHRGGGHPAGTTVAASPRPHATGGSALQSMGFDVLDADHGVLVTADGHEVEIGLPYADAIGIATRVPGGWVAVGNYQGADALAFIAPDGSARTIAVFDYSGNYAISADGGTVVVTQVYGDQGDGLPLVLAAAYALPSGTPIAQTTIPSTDARQVWPVGITGGQVLLTGTGAADSEDAAVWDYRTGSLTDVPVVGTQALAMSDNGEVIYGAPRGDANGNTTEVCLSVVALADLAQVGSAPTTCLSGEDLWTSMSPDGSVVYVDDEGMLRTADLARGDAPVTPVAGGQYYSSYYPQIWTADDRLAVTTIAGTDRPRYTFQWAVCGVDGQCAQAPGPAGFDQPVPVAGRGD